MGPTVILHLEIKQIKEAITNWRAIDYFLNTSCFWVWKACSKCAKPGQRKGAGYAGESVVCGPKKCAHQLFWPISQCIVVIVIATVLPIVFPRFWFVYSALFYVIFFFFWLHTDCLIIFLLRFICFVAIYLRDLL